MPQMQALAERIEEWLRGATFEGYDAARLQRPEDRRARRPTS